MPLPADLDMVLLYIAFLAESRAYVTIINYLSAVWSLHKLHGFAHIDPSSFPLVMTLRGVRRTLGDSRSQARPLKVEELRLIFSMLDMDSSEDVAFWVAILLCFRGLLLKSNVVEEGMAVLISDLQLQSWGVLLTVRRSKNHWVQRKGISYSFYEG